MNYTGTLRYIDLGTGGWRLECDDGQNYDLYGTIPQNLANKRVSIKAKPMSGMGFMMGGQALEVEQIQQL